MKQISITIKTTIWKGLERGRNKTKIEERSAKNKEVKKRGGKEGRIHLQMERNMRLHQFPTNRAMLIMLEVQSRHTLLTHGMTARH